MSKTKTDGRDFDASRCSTFRVVGFAMIPVQIAIEVTNCKTADEAMQTANECLGKYPSLAKGYIVPGTEDHSCVHSFAASRAEKLDT